MLGCVTLFFYARKHNTTLLGKPEMRQTPGSGRARCAEGALCVAFLDTFMLSYEFLAVDNDVLRIVNDPAADGVGEDRIPDLIPPAGDIELRAEYGGRFFVSCLGNLEKIPCLDLFQGIE